MEKCITRSLLGTLTLGTGVIVLCQFNSDVLQLKCFLGLEEQAPWWCGATVLRGARDHGIKEGSLIHE